MISGVQQVERPGESFLSLCGGPKGLYSEVCRLLDGARALTLALRMIS